MSWSKYHFAKYHFAKYRFAKYRFVSFRFVSQSTVSRYQDFFLLWAREWRKKWQWKWSNRPSCWFLSHLKFTWNSAYSISCEGKDAYLVHLAQSTSSSWNKMQNRRVPKQENAYVMYELIIITCTKSSYRKVFFPEWKDFTSHMIFIVFSYLVPAHLLNNIEAGTR